MTERTYLCESCGHLSPSRERCTRCGRDLSGLYQEERDTSWMNRPMLPAWGLITVRLYDSSQAPQLWKEVADFWDWLEAETEHMFLPSQMDKFDTQAPAIELYGSTWAMYRLNQVLAGRGTLEFKELPEDQIPKRPKLPPRFLRKPYVPRRKR
jgi:hypothetical protein